jgi:hypothetical protein
VFSLGMLLFEMLTLQEPFETQKVIGIPDLIEAGETPRIPDEVIANRVEVGSHYLVPFQFAAFVFG